MFRPGNLGHLGRLGLVAASRPGLVAQALAILAKYGSAANLYLPGVGTVSGITAGNWLDSAGTAAATVDNPVGRVDNARGGANLTQSTAANRPILRLAGGVYAWDFVSSDFLQSTQPFFTSATDDGLCCAGVTQRTTTGIQAVVASRGPSASPTNCANSIFFSSGAPLAYWEGAVSDSLVGAPVAAGVPVVVSARKFGSQISLRVNSAVAQSKTATIGGAPISSSAIGASLSGASNAPTLFGNISVSAVAACRGAVSDADAVLIERLVASLTGVTI